MLSEESAVGHYPVQAVQMLARIAEAAEKRLLSQRQTAVAFAHTNMSTSAAIGHAACLLASDRPPPLLPSVSTAPQYAV
jgi:pyruvate kinase